MTNLDENDKFRREAEADIARCAHIPKDMFFPQITGRYSDDTVDSPMAWLHDYCLFRRFETTQGRVAMIEKLSQLGQNGTELADRARGAMVGLVTGDALGVGPKGVARDTACVTSMIGRNDRRPGLWMDAAGMAACVAYSLVRSKELTPSHVLSSLNCWYRYGAFTNNGAAPEVDASIRNILERFTPDGPLPIALQQPVNGALCSVAPVVIFYADAPIELALGAVERLASIISAHSDHIDACKALAFAMHGFLNGRTKQDILGSKANWAFSIQSSKVRAIADGSFRTMAHEHISSTGDAADTLEAALWALWNSDNFRQGALQCVNLGDESVILGAVYGQIAGSLYGETAIPIEWIVQTFAFQGFYDFAARLLK